MTTITAIHSATPVATHERLDPRLVSFVKPESFEADQYRMLRYAVEQACPSAESRVIAVTSAIPGDGKTLTSINLAGAVSKAAKSRVLLIDADLRRPSIAKVLGHTPVRRGWDLVDAVFDKRLSLEQIAWRFEDFDLSIVTARRPQAETYDLLASQRFGELIREARQKFDFIVLDTAPVLPAPDSRLLADWIDGYVIVVAADKTPRKLLEETLALLGAARILGLVFNRESYHGTRYGRYYYQAYTTRK